MNTQNSGKDKLDKIAIIGAGLGGLATAIALQSKGFDVQVYEKAHEFRPAGTGLGHWSEGRVTLLGDAAHPMAPALGQGANCTFEDAYELQACLSQESNLEAALIHYEQRRIERTQAIQHRSALGEMRYYETETFGKQMQERSQIVNNDEFQNWLYTYKPC